jgi:16S rRNA (cytidine1402-2'-O)-methyltransferase
VVATPLGNPGDASARARETLAGASLILAEDTRRAGLLLQRLGIENRGRLVSFFEHNEAGRIPRVLEALEKGLDVALVSDAGTPLVADPGYRLVRAVRLKGHPVSPVPGPSAVTAALSACGLPPHPFAFLGFAPRKDSAREALFADWAGRGCTLVLFERKDRLAPTLEAAARVLGGQREFCVARELTKDHEQFILGTLGSLPDLGGGGPDRDTGGAPLRGEITLVIGPAASGNRTPEPLLEQVLQEESASGGRPREVCRRAASRVQGWSAGEIYDRLLAMKDRG